MSATSNKKKDKNSRLEIVMKSVDEITPYANNPRKNEATGLKLKKIIDQIGFLNPIVLDENDIIVAGHARLKAALMLGLNEVPCVYAYGLTEDEIKGYRLADNKTAEIAGWDYDKLVQEMADLSNIGFDMDFTAFNEAEQLYYSEDDKTPEPVDKSEFKEYEQEANNEILQAFNVCIICENKEDQEWLKQHFHETHRLKRLYTAKEIIFMQGIEGNGD